MYATPSKNTVSAAKTARRRGFPAFFARIDQAVHQRFDTFMSAAPAQSIRKGFASK
jgi:hypothetical protein